MDVLVVTYSAALNNVAGIEVVAVNDLTDVKTLAHLLKYDTTHGHLDGYVEVGEGDLKLTVKEVKVFAERNPGNFLGAICRR